jgi:hypothetical protein
LNQLGSIAEIRETFVGFQGGAIEPNIQLALGHNAEIALKKLWPIS